MTQLLAVVVPFASRSLAERLVLVVHISAGSLSIILGFVALSAAKGAPLHRQVGILFVYAMVVMGLLGATVATVWGRSAFVNIPAGLLSAYMVISALATVRPTSRLGSRRWSVGLMLVPLGVGLYNLTFGLTALASASGLALGVPPFPFFLVATIGLVAATGDIRMLRSGALQGTRRLARHLWRMTFALFIATGSFFLGQAKVIPKPIRIFPLLAIPPLVVLVAMVYWLWRVRVRRSLRGMVGVSEPEAARSLPPPVAYRRVS
jgi:uncharacterized membrane protein